MSQEKQAKMKEIDEASGSRTLALDPEGYFVIFKDEEHDLIRAAHYTAVIDEHGIALDPETGLAIEPMAKISREPTRIYSGRTAQEICVQIFEHTHPCPVTDLAHAAYLGREFARVERAIVDEAEYIQE